MFITSEKTRETLKNKKLFVGPYRKEIIKILNDAGFIFVTGNFDVPFLIIDEFGHISPETSPDRFYSDPRKEIRPDIIINLHILNYKKGDILYNSGIIFCLNKIEDCGDWFRYYFSKIVNISIKNIYISEPFFEADADTLRYATDEEIQILNSRGK